MKEWDWETIQRIAPYVILQAWFDAEHWRDSYNRAASRRFLTGATKDWRERLDMWCMVCQTDSELVVEKARKKFWDKERIEKYKRNGR